MLRRTVAIATLVTLLAGSVQAQHRAGAPTLHVLQDLARYEGTYPCTNGLLHSPVLLTALSQVLGRQYRAYRAHMALSGCGAIAQRGDYILMDVSQLHVGGYTSIILIRKRDGVLFLFWLNGEVDEQHDHIFGPRPIPPDVFAILIHDLNVGWGHVACFAASGDSLAVDTTRRANQDAGTCLRE